jgi:hypothetical protein
MMMRVAASGKEWKQTGALPCHFRALPGHFRALPSHFRALPSHFRVTSESLPSHFRVTSESLPSLADLSPHLPGPVSRAGQEGLLPVRSVSQSMAASTDYPWYVNRCCQAPSISNYPWYAIFSRSCQAPPTRTAAREDASVREARPPPTRPVLVRGDVSVAGTCFVDLVQGAAGPSDPARRRVRQAASDQRRNPPRPQQARRPSASSLRGCCTKRSPLLLHHALLLHQGQSVGPALCPGPLS